MPKLERWIVASKMVPVFDRDVLERIVALGGNVGGGWCEIHQHVHVTAENKEAVEELLTGKGYTVTAAGDFATPRPVSGRFPGVRDSGAKPSADKS